MRPGSDVLARHSFLFEEFIARELDAGHFRPASSAAGENRACCTVIATRKALNAMPAVTRVLS